MSRPDFGFYTYGKEISLKEDLSELLFNIKQTNIVNAKLLLSEFYEYKTGIYNHVNPKKIDPLAIVSFHDAEDITKDSYMELMIRSYIRYDIQRVFGLNLVEYLQYPPDVIDLLRRICSESSKEKNETLEKIEKELKELDKQ